MNTRVFLFQKARSHNLMFRQQWREKSTSRTGLIITLRLLCSFDSLDQRMSFVALNDGVANPKVFSIN